MRISAAIDSRTHIGFGHFFDNSFNTMSTNKQSLAIVASGPAGTLQLKIPASFMIPIDNNKNNTPITKNLSIWQIFQRKLYFKLNEFIRSCDAACVQIILAVQSFFGIKNNIEKIIGTKTFREIEKLNKFLLMGNGGDNCFMAATLNALRLYKSLNPEIPVRINSDFMDYENSFKWAINALINNPEYGYYFRQYADDNPPYLFNFETAELGALLSNVAPNLLLEKAIGGNYNNYTLAYDKKIIPKEASNNNIPINSNGHFIDYDSLEKTIKDLEKGSIGVLSVSPFNNDSSDGHDLTIVKFIRGKNFNKVMHDINYSPKDTLSEEEMKDLGYFIVYEQNTNSFISYPVEKLLNRTDSVLIYLISPPSNYQANKTKPDKNVAQETVNAYFLAEKDFE